MKTFNIKINEAQLRLIADAMEAMEAMRASRLRAGVWVNVMPETLNLMRQDTSYTPGGDASVDTMIDGATAFMQRTFKMTAEGKFGETVDFTQ